MKKFVEELIKKYEEIKEKNEPKVNGKTTPRDMIVYKMTIGYVEEITNKFADEYKPDSQEYCLKVLTDKQKEEYKAEILNEVMYRANDVIGGYPIDQNILQDICDEIRNDKNI